MNRTPIRHRILQAAKDKKISRAQPFNAGDKDTWRWLPEEGGGLGTELTGADLRAARELFKVGLVRTGKALGPSMYNPRVMTITYGADELLADWDQEAAHERRQAEHKAETN